MGALEAYCWWLPGSPSFRGIGDDRPAADMFEWTMVQATCRLIARSIWHQARRGWMNANGQRHFLSTQYAGGILGRCSRAWESDFTIRRGLMRWLTGGEPARVSAAMRAIASTPLSTEEQTAVDLTDRRWFGEDAGGPLWLQSDLMSALQTAATPLLERLRDLLAKLSSEQSPRGIIAAAACLTPTRTSFLSRARRVAYSAATSSSPGRRWHSWRRMRPTRGRWPRAASWSSLTRMACALPLSCWSFSPRSSAGRSSRQPRGTHSPSPGSPTTISL